MLLTKIIYLSNISETSLRFPYHIEKTNMSKAGMLSLQCSNSLENFV